MFSTRGESKDYVDDANYWLHPDFETQGWHHPRSKTSVVSQRTNVLIDVFKKLI